MKMNKITSIAIVALFILCAFAYVPSADGTSDSGDILFDKGNGDTVWGTAAVSSGDTLSDIFGKVASSNDITYSYSSGTVTVDSVTSTTVGTVTSSWKLLSWNGSEWTSCPITDLSNTYAGGSYALAFYPDGMKPAETPDYKTSWTMIRGDSRQTGNQTATYSETSDAVIKWKETQSGTMGVCSSPLSVQNYVFIKYNSNQKSGTEYETLIKCYKLNGEEVWSFYYPGLSLYETSTPVIAGDYIYFTSGLGYIFKMPWKTGPGTDNSDVTTFDNAPYNESDVKSRVGALPYETGAELTGTTYSTGCGSLIFDSGCIYCMASNGMVYCFDTDLHKIWSYQMGGHMYYLSPTVFDNYIFAGALNGHLYILDKTDGSLVCSQKIFTKTYNNKEYGSVSSVSVFKDNSKYYLFASVSDGRGMDTTVGGLMRAVFNGSSITSCTVDTETYGVISHYLTTVESQNFNGVYLTSTNGLFKIDISGTYTKLNDTLAEIHAPGVLVNGTQLYLSSYTAGKPNYIVGLDGKLKASIEPPAGIRNYCMAPMLVLGDYVVAGNDSGTYCIYGEFPEYTEPVSESGTPLWQTAVNIIFIIIAIIILLYCGLKFIGKKERPFGFITDRVGHFLNGNDYSHNTRNKHRLLVVLLIGLALTVIMFMVSLCCGSGDNLPLDKAWNSLWSAISKNGQNLTYEETLVYSSRLPRTLAAIAVGIGLSIAGSIYQAIIRNPLVDPYIMGISSGAGTAAIAVIAFDFTFFGLLPSNSPFTTAIVAMVGGLIAFACTMFIAEKSGGSSVNYVLAGVVVGLAFSAVQTLMMSMAGNKISNALAWLFGSFSNVSWSQVWFIVIPAIALSAISLIWAKEFNLVLLGEDQAKQMGLNVKWFNRGMLILASVLTSICVAFVGVIGFVGLVVPHLCRMILGGDHRMVMPTSIVLGAFLMMLADFASRMLILGQELPVGAITTIIGVPVFAWLLIKKGRMYDG